MTDLAEIAIIGGSGLYSLLDGPAERITPQTPYGAPSDAITVGEMSGRRVAFLPRHGANHRHAPHGIPYRANIWALRSIGCRQILAPCAVGGLLPELGPGSFVVPDQLIDRTSGTRERTYYETGAVHVNFADPYCPDGRRAVLSLDFPLTDCGTMVVIDGPRFSTRAESRWYAASGGTTINMTGMPEAILARELALCYTTIALVTDHDAGVEGDRGVTQQEVFAVFRENTERMRALLLAAVAALPRARTCPCPTALDGLPIAKR